MPMRIETLMSNMKPAEVATDRARDIRMQGLNHKDMQTVEERRAEELRKPQDVEKMEDSRVNADDEGHNQADSYESEQKQRRPKDEPELPAADLQQLAADKILALPVDKGKFAHKEEHRIDIVL